MLAVLYIAALIIGAGTLAVQLLTSGDADGGDADAAGNAAPSSIVLGLRFWSFALLAFGLSGTLLHYLRLLSPLPVLALALVMGLGSGLLAAWALRSLGKDDTTSGAEASDAIGQTAQVLVPVSKARRGKVRIQLKGQLVDLIATTDDEELAIGTSVVIEEVRGTHVHVARATELFLPRE